MLFEKFERSSFFSAGKEKIDKEKEPGEVEESFRKFLAKQISLPEERWGQEFKDYVQRKYQEGKEPILERSPEEEQKLTFERYLKGLALKEEDLKEKRILDLGCGERGEFVKECLKRGLTGEIFGQDLVLKKETMENFKGHFVKGKFEEEIPFKEMDYIISVGAIEAPSSEDELLDPKKTIENALKALKPNGEIRIYPLRKAPPGSELKGIEFARKKWLEILKDLSLEEKIKYTLEPVDIKVAGEKPDVWLEETLIVKKIH